MLDQSPKTGPIVAKAGNTLAHKQFPAMFGT
ncbi:MAG: hypothetical protein ACJAXU_000833 [Paracoccaceae bacterium]|jgi:hypothetical protein